MTPPRYLSGLLDHEYVPREFVPAIRPQLPPLRHRRAKRRWELECAECLATFSATARGQETCSRACGNARRARVRERMGCRGS
jgi:hypothetical protein